MERVPLLDGAPVLQQVDVVGIDAIDLLQVVFVKALTDVVNTSEIKYLTNRLL